MLTLHVGGKSFSVPRELLLKSVYFEGLLATNPEQIIVPRSRYGFRHVLEFLYDDTYPVPNEHLRELDFYGVPYHHYSAERDDNVKIYVRGEKFKLPAKFLILNSKYFAKELPILYVGQDLYLDRSVEGFRHVLQRMSNCYHVIPYEYREEYKFYGVQEIVWLENTLLTVTCGTEYQLSYKQACESPYLKSILDKYESLPRFNCIQEQFERVMQYLKQSPNVRMALECDRSIYELFGLKPDRYYIESWRKCSAHVCSSFTNILESVDGWFAANNRYYCPSHTCNLCKNQKESGSSYCKEHTCSSWRCVKQVTEGGKCVEHQ